MQFFYQTLSIKLEFKSTTRLVLKRRREQGEGQIFYILITYSNHLKTGLVWYSNGRFVSVCQTVRYLNCGLKTRLKKPVNGPKCPVFKWSAKSRDLVISIPDTHTVWYSDESGFQVFSIQMVTVLVLFGRLLHILSSSLTHNKMLTGI